MKLIGNGKKDYFDFLIHQYGEDPLVVLDRRPIGEFKPDYSNSQTGSYSGKHVDKKYGNLNSDRVYYDTISRQFEDTTIWLVLNGKVYPLVLTGTYQSVYTIANDTNSQESSKSRWWASRYEFTTVDTEITNFVELSKEVNRHCFIFHDYREPYISPEVPNLAELGLAKIKSPQEVYLETVDFIAKNFAKEMEVSIPQTNKEKIVGHGFDLKTSFRGKN